MTPLTTLNNDQPAITTTTTTTRTAPDDNMMETTNKTLHIAPMLNYSTREFRQLFRILSQRCTLWTEMVVDDTVAHAPNLDEHLDFCEKQHPLVCQIGGNCPTLCGQATQIAIQTYGYDEINLNVDCPSDRVSGEREFGAVLLTKADLVVDILTSMQQKSNESTSTSRNSSSSSSSSSQAAAIPISIKTRVGVDDWDDMEFIASFIRKLSPVCKKFYMHARKCVLGGILNARQNRSIPPLNYPRVYELCRMFPDCEFWINGGIHSLKDAKLIAYGTNMIDVYANTNPDEAENDEPQEEEYHSVPCHLCCHPNNNSKDATTAIPTTNGSCTAPPKRSPPNLRGVMLGRAAMDNPAMFWDVDRYFYGEVMNPCQTRRQVLEKYCLYLEETYPRRCCDNDDRISYEYPPPRDIVQDQEYCHICASMYSCGASDPLNTSNPCKRDDTNLLEKKGSPLKLLPSSTSEVAPISKQKKAVKISSRIIGRSLKPVQGIFYNMPKSRAFRKACDRLGQNIEVRNCGPGYIIRKAMESIPAKILDEDLIKTERLQ